MNQIRKTFFVVLILTAGLFACEKNEEDTLPVEDSEAVLAEASADATFEQIDNIALGALMESGAFNGRKQNEATDFSGCAVLTLDQNARKLTVDFGDGCTGEQGHVRSGKLIISYTSTSWSILFSNFKVDGLSVEGTRTQTIVSGDNNLTVWTVELQDGKIIWPDGSFITRDLSHTKSWNAGTGELRVEGAASGINKKGVNYSSVISSPLVYLQTCIAEGIVVPVKGVLQIERSNPDKATITADFGTGECDKLVEVRVGKYTKVVEAGA